MDLQEQQLKKLTIDAYENQDYQPPMSSTWQALFNPTQLSFSRSVRYNETPAAGSSKPEVAYGGGQPDELSVDLFLDGTGVVETFESVGSRIDRLISYMEFIPDTHQPYYIHLHWGPFNFRGVLTKVDVKYTLFDRDGNPLRATATLVLKESIAREEVSAKENASSPDLYQTWLVSEGENLDVIAERVYGSPAWWRPIAEANRLANPRSLVAGQVLTLPPRVG